MNEDRKELSGQEKDSSLTRRRLLQGAGGLMAASVLPADATEFPPKQAPRPAATSVADLTGQLAKYMVVARDRALPPKVLVDAKHRVLDGLGAVISGAKLKPGEAATRFARAQGGTPEASVLTTDIKTNAINAALVNGMFAHADETDDVDPLTKAHPGAAVVPAALAMAEREQRSGMELIRAVALGYDLGCRFVLSLGGDILRENHRDVDGPCCTFGAMAAAASLARLDEKAMRFAISYAVQQVSGPYSWVEDHDHVEKAFDIGGMGARNGVTAAIMAQMGFTGVDKVLTCRHNAFEALAVKADPGALVADLGSRFFVSETGIKTYSVGNPNQAPMDAIFALRKQYGLTADNVERVVVKLPKDGALIVNNSPMADVNCQHLIATALVDGAVSFANSHSQEHMADARIRAVMQKVTVVADPELTADKAAPRSGKVEVTMRGGRTVSHFTRFPPGMKENPLTTEEMNEKARGLMTPVLGAQKTEEAIKRINTLEETGNMRDLIRSLLTV